MMVYTCLRHNVGGRLYSYSNSIDEYDDENGDVKPARLNQVERELSKLTPTGVDQGSFGRPVGNKRQNA